MSIHVDKLRETIAEKLKADEFEAHKITIVHSYFYGWYFVDYANIPSYAYHKLQSWYADGRKLNLGEFQKMIESL